MLTYNSSLDSCQDIAICRDSAAALSSITSLRNVSIEFHEDNGQILDVDTDATEQSLDRFRHLEEQFTFAGLRKLSLLTLWGDVIAWRNQILEIILNSPDLEFLALSLSQDALYGPDDETGGAGLLDLLLRTDMFEWLSREYAKATGRPLQFKNTNFHYGTKKPGAIVVEGWADPNGLDVVFIWNEGNAPFLNGIEACPTSSIGPELVSPDDEQ